MIVYVVQNQTNNKVYVGQTTRAFARRWSEHVWHAAHESNAPLARALRKYGADVFDVIEMWELPSKDALNTYERALIEQYQSRGRGYNGTFGGQYSPGTAGKNWKWHNSDSKKGERHHMAKLTEKQVFNIRVMSAQGIPNIRIAQIFKVEPNTISRVVSGKRWSHTLPEELKGADLRRFNYMG